MIEILLAAVIGFALGVIFTLYLFKYINSRKIVLNPNDYTVPTRLELFNGFTTDRGFSVNGSTITMYWKHEKCQQQREVRVTKTPFTQADFDHYWEQSEINFYLKNQETFKPKEETND